MWSILHIFLECDGYLAVQLQINWRSVVLGTHSQSIGVHVVTVSVAVKPVSSPPHSEVVFSGEGQTKIQNSVDDLQRNSHYWFLAKFRQSVVCTFEYLIN